MTGADRLGREELRAELLVALRTVMTARGLADVGHGEDLPERVADLLAEAAASIGRARRVRGLPVAQVSAP